jgi:hypothetical protein
MKDFYYVIVLSKIHATLLRRITLQAKKSPGSNVEESSPLPYTLEKMEKD